MTHNVSLDAAARIRRMLDHGIAPVCPDCGSPLTGLTGGTGERELIVLRCDACGATVTMELAPGLAAG